MNAPMLVDFQANGVTTKGLLKPARNGYLYWLKRDTDGSIAYLRSQGFVPQNVFTSIDKETGRPEVDLAHKPATGKSAQFCPGLWGGKDWPYEAYNPKTGMVYIPSNENHCNTLEGKVEKRVPGQWWTGVAIPDLHFTVDTKAPFYGELQALDVNTGKRVWRTLYPNSMMWGSVLTTAADCSSPAALTTACSAPMTPTPAKSCGTSRPTPASSRRLRLSRSMACNISRCNPATASTLPSSKG